MTCFIKLLPTMLFTLTNRYQLFWSLKLRDNLCDNFHYKKKIHLFFYNRLRTYKKKELFPSFIVVFLQNSLFFDDYTILLINLTRVIKT